MSLAKRKAQYKVMQRLVVDDCPVAFILEAATAEAYLAKVQAPPRGIWGLNDALLDTAVKA